MKPDKKPKTALTHCDNTMTSSQFLSWVRSALRSKWLRWPPRATCIKNARRPYVGPNKLQKFEVECKLCNGWFRQKDIEVDHFAHDAGSILSVDDIGQFCHNLYCDSKDLRTVCKPCHKIYSLSQSAGITFEQARFEKGVNEKMKLPAKELLTWLVTMGYDVSSCSNQTKRRQCVAEILKEKQNGTNN